jgi:hypothetical protein
MILTKNQESLLIRSLILSIIVVDNFPDLGKLIGIMKKMLKLVFFNQPGSTVRVTVPDNGEVRTDF